MSAAEAELAAQLAAMGWSCTRHDPSLVFERAATQAPEAGREDAGSSPGIVRRVSPAEVAAHWAGGRVRGIGHLASLSVVEMLEVFDGARGELRDGREGFRVYPI